MTGNWPAWRISWRKTALDGIESFTLAPEGDMMYAEARQSLGEKFIWSNISLGLYRLPEAALRAHIRRSASEASWLASRSGLHADLHILPKTKALDVTMMQAGNSEISTTIQPLPGSSCATR